MANSREIKLIEKEFLNKNDKELKKNLFLVNGSLPSTTVNLPSTFSLENSVYETKNLEKKSIKLKEDSNLELSGCGILYLEVSENINLELNFNSEEFNNIVIKILVKENKKLNLIEYSNAKNAVTHKVHSGHTKQDLVSLYKNIEIVLEKNSSLNNSQFILNSIVNQTKVNLFENSIYNLKSVYFGDNSKNYINNIANHIEKNSKSDLQINGLAKENSKIINDSKIIIGKNAINSIGHQKMKNLILDEKSQIQSEPILEVKNNNVTCSHSSSISQISDRILYYINSRGICKSDAIDLISSSYFNEVIESISNERLKEKYLKRLEIRE